MLAVSPTTAPGRTWIPNLTSQGLLPSHLTALPRTHRILAGLSTLCLAAASLGFAPGSGSQPLPAAADAPRPDDRERALERFFEQEVRPLLAARCFECHGPDREHPRSGLALASHEALLRGGHRGPAIDTDEPQASPLLRAVRREGELAMPPDEPLSLAEVAILERWVELGAPWPESAARPHGPDDAARAHWAWSPPQRPSPPEVRREDLVREPLDRFVLARLEAAGLEPNPPATERELVRRLHYDLLGLPPTHGEVEAYVADPSPDKWEALVEELLARPEYGERWGRRWLDVVRFAQTNGYERDTEKPYAHGYRDYVIRSFAEDKPYDRFLLEQLAGDELDAVTRDSLVATGFYRLGAWDSEPDDRLQAEMDELDDMLGAIGEGLLGLTITCARCHDHLTDPVSQEEYYGLLAFLRNVEGWSRPEFSLASALLRPWNPSAEDLETWERERLAAIGASLRQREERIAAARAELRQKLLAERGSAPREAAARPASDGTDEEPDPLDARLEELAADRAVIATFDGIERQRLFLLEFQSKELSKSFEGHLDWLLVVTEREEPRPTHVLARGNARAPLAEVEPGFPAILSAAGAATPSITPRLGDLPHSGRRRALAEWIASPEHPTTARVIANRVWQGLFGRGIVATPNDLGLTGAAPTHPELLDWLAVELVEQGWSLKALQRRILGSYAYRMSSRAASERARELDPDNALLWRQELRRLDAEALRDTLLAVAGDLNPERGGRGFFPLLAREALAGASKPGEGLELSPPGERRRRSVYTFVKRGLLPPLLEAFDLANPNLSVGVRPSTTTATQALALLNDEFVGERAHSLARRVLESAQDDAGTTPGPGRVQRLVRELWRAALARDPSPRELQLALEHLERQERAAADLRPALVLEPRFPPRLQIDFLAALPDDAFLHLPGEDWHALRGRWGNEYNDTREVDPAVGPAALLTEPSFADGIVRLRVLLREGCEQAGFLVRAGAAQGEPVGLEFVLDPAAGECRWVHLAGPEQAPRVLRRAPLALELERAYELTLELREGYASARLDGTPLLRVTDLEHRAPGLFGLRASGAALELGELRLWAPGAERLVEPPPLEPELVALESLCLAVLNLNELVHID